MSDMNILKIYFKQAPIARGVPQCSVETTREFDNWADGSEIDTLVIEMCHFLMSLGYSEEVIKNSLESVLANYL